MPVTATTKKGVGLQRFIKQQVLAGIALLFTMVLALGGCASEVGSGANSSAVLAGHAPAYDLTQPASLPPRLIVPFEQRGPYLLVHTRINGRRGGLFLLDTGSALDAVSVGVANRMGLPKAQQGTAIGIGGRETYHQRRVQRWQISGVAMTSKTLAGLQLGRLNQAAPFQANGVLGYRALNHVPFTLDPANQKLHLHNPERFTPPENARKLELLHHAYLPAVRATLGNGQPVILILDSGADNALTLPRSVLDRWPELAAVPHTGGGRSRGIGGTIESTRTWLKTLRIFGLDLHDVPVAFETSDPSLQSARVPVGRIGMQLLGSCRLTFHAEDEALYVEWLPGRDKPAE
jgi:hypothetical protein